ncbi:MAG: thermonuclease family protein [Alphaproteobacteria bacterium]|jgi:endonuclease YncB( thermonuclease family)|nr:thermonuclease family protein [Alphaproteobacteria bacterium]
MKLILLVILGYLIIAPAMAGTISGPVEVVDAATLRIGGQLVRLNGIAAPKPGDQCLMRGRQIPCGRVATTALKDLTAGMVVRCQTHGRAGPRGVILATCAADDYDLSEGMIYTGWARPDKRATARYREVEKAARKRRRGLWRGEFPKAVNRAAVSR